MNVADGVTLYCLPLKDAEPGKIPGSKPAACSKCLQAVIVAPTGQDLIRKKRAIIVCFDCLLKSPEAMLELISQGQCMTREQARELKLSRTAYKSN